ncbi:MAG TPA: hypothetical protein VNH64_03420 [Parvularculaceae bacterium]|nr:hypothetical protein [Parvularculaceae bacterium]
MKKILLAAVLAASTPAYAENWDVIRMQLQNNCTLPQLMTIVTDFNKWGADYGYHAQIAAPIQSQDVTSIFWVGKSADAATFGKAWDAWRDAQADAKSTPAMLNARFQKCTKNMERSGYDVY